MSEKFNAKNLAYNKSLPPFLAALRSQNASPAGGPDPLLAANRRRGVKRSGSAEAEDAPVVVDGEGNVVEARVEGDGTVRCEGGDAGVGDEAGGEKEKEEGKVVSIGRKRKARVVGAGQEDEESSGKKGEEPLGKTSVGKDDKAGKAGEQPGEKASDGKSAPKPKKKAKKIKLSFDEDT